MAGNPRLLLDTNIVIALLESDPAVVQRLAESVEAFVPSVALGELYYGALRSARTEANLARLEEFAASTTVLAATAATARHYGDVKNALRAKGRPIPDNDIWIAALAREHQLTLVSRDRHFAEIEDLSLAVW